ncbi:Xaa-Pro dipeptidase PepQ [Gottschalkiaceae bacterium SANA]|nr:Xaa-Pro dipeptidase PepQ [Gottschalkiaceae bacterium SANA]
MEYIKFTEEDVQARIDLCQKKMNEQGFEGIVFSAESNLNYYSNFHTHAPWTTFTRPMFLFVPKEGKPVLYLHIFQTPDARAISKACDIRGFESLLGPNASQVAEIMHELNMGSGKIGFEKGYEQLMGFQINLYEGLKEELSSASFEDASDLIWSQRLIKSPKEIECIRRACDATSYAHDKIFKNIKAGMTEHEVSRLVKQYMLEGGADQPGFVLITAGEGNYDRISKTATDRELQDGDLIVLDLGSCYNGYWSDFCRLAVVGEISEERREIQRKVHEVTIRASKVMKPGVAVADVARACAEEMVKVGFEANFDCGRMGHGMGLMSTEPPSVTIYDETILEEGMIINLEPGIVNELGAFNLEENFVITKDGCEMLSSASREFYSI